MNRRLTQQEWIEFVKCKQDPVYFIQNYCFLQHRVVGKIPFHLYKFQQVCIRLFLKNIFSVLLKNRQMGLSWLVAAYALWLVLFHTDKKVLMISIKDKTAKALLKKVYFMWRNLPDFLQGELLENNMSKIVFQTGSEIESVPTSEEAGRSESLSLLIIDEAAYVRWMEDIWQAAFPTLSTGGQAIVLSTPNGMGNFYYKLWHEAVEGKNLFKPIRLHWWYHPSRTQKWFEIQKANMSPMQLAQEVLGDFIASGNLVFPLDQLRALFEECSMVQPLETLYTEEINPREKCGLYIYEKPDPAESYILSADTAKGGGSDFHGAHVTSRSTGKQVAEYRTNVALDLFNRRIYELGELYNYALAAIENNNMGVATNLYFASNNYPSIYEYKDPLRPGRSDVGFPTNSMTRPILIDEMTTCLREEVSGIQGIRTASELMHFAWSKKGKAEAMPGKHDDLVISYGIGRYVRATTSVEPDCLPTYYS